MHIMVKFVNGKKLRIVAGGVRRRRRRFYLSWHTNERLSDKSDVVPPKKFFQ